MKAHSEPVATALNSSPPTSPLAHAWPAAVGLATAIVFLRSLSFDFVQWDDMMNFVFNPSYRGLGLSNLAWMWTTHQGNYHPLTWMSHGLDYVLWGMHAPGYHLTSVALHCANSVLMYFVALELLTHARAPGSAVALRVGASAAALAFSIHPLRVESVAWVTERRDVLSGLFTLLCVWLYLRERAEGLDPPSRRRARWLSLLAFAASLLSKASAMMLPFALLVLDVYPLRRGPWLVREKLPYFAVSAACAIVALVSQAVVGAMVTLEQHGPLQRLAQASFGLWFYVWKTLAPWGLVPFYPLELNLAPASPKYVLSVLGLGAAGFVLWRLRARWPAGLAAFTCYGLLVSPVLGLAQSGAHLVADRFSYLPCLPFALLAGAGARTLWEWARPHRLARGGVALGLLSAASALGAQSYRQSGIWGGSLTLWEHTLAVGYDDRMIQHALGMALKERGDLHGALRAFDRAMEQDPTFIKCLNIRAQLKRQLGDAAGAYSDFEQSLRVRTEHNSPAWAGRGLLRLDRGEYQGALEDLSVALQSDPTLTEVYTNRAFARRKLGDRPGAWADISTALLLNPDMPEAHGLRGEMLQERGDLAGAAADYRWALVAAPLDWPFRQLTAQRLRALETTLRQRAAPTTPE